MVKVCDAIMGSGKTSSAIRYMNEHADEKFIYITPYLAEAARIKEACPELHFVEPDKDVGKRIFTKTQHSAELIAEGRNLATTHQAFRRYTQETLADIRRQGYTLLIDENVDALEKYTYNEEDLSILKDSGFLAEENGCYIRTERQYNGAVFRPLFDILDYRTLMRIQGHDGDGAAFYWLLPPELITAFKDVIIMTYLFDGQSIHHLLKMYDIPYTMIGIKRDKDGYRFCDGDGDVPEYVYHLNEKIHILDKPKLNVVGDARTALSISWFDRSRRNVDCVRKNVRNVLRNIWADAPSEQKLWGSFVDMRTKVGDKGFTRLFLPFNTRATNAYKDRDRLVYAANIFMNVGEKKFYTSHGVVVDEEQYALSTLVQWVWRSAIRDGKDIYIYIPSRRMRELLIGWMESLRKEDAA